MNLSEYIDFLRAFAIKNGEGWEVIVTGTYYTGSERFHSVKLRHKLEGDEHISTEDNWREIYK